MCKCVKIRNQNYTASLKFLIFFSVLHCGLTPGLCDRMIQVPVRFLREEIVCELIVVFKNGLHEFIKKSFTSLLLFCSFCFFLMNKNSICVCLHKEQRCVLMCSKIKIIAHVMVVSLLASPAFRRERQLWIRWLRLSRHSSEGCRTPLAFIK